MPKPKRPKPSPRRARTRTSSPLPARELDEAPDDAGELEPSRALVPARSSPATGLAVAPSPLVPAPDDPDFPDADPRFVRHIADNFSENTKRAYRFGWMRFASWCRAHGHRDVPASVETLKQYLMWHLERTENRDSIATLEIVIASINFAHSIRGLVTQTGHHEVRALWRALKRRYRPGETVNRAAPAVLEIVEAMCENLPDTEKGLRDRAILALGFRAALRRSEIAHLRVEDIGRTARGITIRLGVTKTDQEGKGATVIVHRASTGPCAVEALETWLRASRITTGPIFRCFGRWGELGKRPLSANAIWRVVTEAAEAAGLDPKAYSPHSLRAGLATSAARANKPQHVIKAHGRWKSDATVSLYIRPVKEDMDENAADLDDADDK